MQPKTPKLLEDMRDAAAFVLEIAAERTLEDMVTDRMFRQTVERNFEIIGEAMSKLARLDPETTEQFVDHPQIIGLRNVLIHGYDIIEPAQIWHIVRDRLPEFHETVLTLMEKARLEGLL